MVSADVRRKPRHWTNAWLRMKVVQSSNSEHLCRKSGWKRQIGSISEVLLAIDRVVMKLGLQCVFNLPDTSAERNLVSVAGNAIHDQALRLQPRSYFC